MGMSNYTNLLKQKSQKFFTDISDSNKPDVNNKNIKGFSEKIQIKVSITEINEDCSYKVHLFNVIENEKNVINEYVDCKSEDGITTNLNSLFPATEQNPPEDFYPQSLPYSEIKAEPDNESGFTLENYEQWLDILFFPYPDIDEIPMFQLRLVNVYFIPDLDVGLFKSQVT